MIKLINILNEIEIGVTPNQCLKLLMSINKRNTLFHERISIINTKYVDRIDINNAVEGKHIVYSMDQKDLNEYYQDLLKLKRNVEYQNDLNEIEIKPIKDNKELAKFLDKHKKEFLEKTKIYSRFVGDLDKTPFYYTERTDYAAMGLGEGWYVLCSLEAKDRHETHINFKGIKFYYDIT